MQVMHFFSDHTKMVDGATLSGHKKIDMFKFRITPENRVLGGVCITQLT